MRARRATVEAKDFHVSRAVDGVWEPMGAWLSVEAMIAQYQGRIVKMRHKSRTRMIMLSRTGTVKMRRLNQGGCRSICVM